MLYAMLNKAMALFREPTELLEEICEHIHEDSRSDGQLRTYAASSFSIEALPT